MATDPRFLRFNSATPQPKNFGPNDPAFLSFDSSEPQPTGNEAIRHRPTRARPAAQNPPQVPDIPHWAIEGEDTAWDTIVFRPEDKQNRLEFFGAVHVSGAAISHKMDVRSPQGSSGGKAVWKGKTLPQIKIRLTLWSNDDKNNFRRLVAALKENGNNAPPAIPVYYPSLALFGIQAITVQELGLPEPGNISNTIDVELTCYEHTDTKQVTSGATRRATSEALLPSGYPPATVDATAGAPSGVGP